jgi:hypothetical protein
VRAVTRERYRGGGVSNSLAHARSETFRSSMFVGVRFVRETHELTQPPSGTCYRRSRPCPPSLGRRKRDGGGVNRPRGRDFATTPRRWHSLRTRALVTVRRFLVPRNSVATMRPEKNPDGLMRGNVDSTGRGSILLRGQSPTALPCRQSVCRPPSPREAAPRGEGCPFCHC